MNNENECSKISVPHIHCIYKNNPREKIIIPAEYRT